MIKICFAWLHLLFSSKFNWFQLKTIRWNLIKSSLNPSPIESKMNPKGSWIINHQQRLPFSRLPVGLLETNYADKWEHRRNKQKGFFSTNDMKLMLGQSQILRRFKFCFSRKAFVFKPFRIFSSRSYERC